MSGVRIGLLLGAALAACALAGSARADGDPASDYLIAQQVFLPFDAKIPVAGQRRLTALVAAANRSGFKIRVAVIWSSYDLGAITSLWKQPRTYARFLGEELSFLYKQRLLIVMPAGFGFHWAKHSTGREYALLAKVPIAATPSGLVTAAGTAVQRLAAADGVTLSDVPAVGSPASRNRHDRLVIALAAVAGLAILVLLRQALRIRGRPR